MPKKALVQLTYIINASLKLSYFPTTWKQATVLAFRKPGKDKLFPQNYRPVRLLPTMSKILEKIILNRLKRHENENKQLMHEQLGFREHRSTVHQLARLTNHISTEFNRNKSTVLILLDIEKAFDTVWHDGLIHKLNEHNVPMYIIKILQNYLTDRTFTVSVNNVHSGTKTIAAGVPQGSILGPRLFIYYLNDLPKDEKTNLALFADDTAIYSSSWKKYTAIKNIQNHLDKLTAYYNKWKIKINAAKTEQVNFTKKKQEKRKD